MTRRDNVRSQLDAYEGLDVLSWQPGTGGTYLVTPALGTELRLSLREAELFVSGVATGRVSMTEPTLPAAFSLIEGPFAERLVREARATVRGA